MSKFRLIFGFLFLIAAVTFGQNNVDHDANKIKVRGEAELKIPADRALLTFDVEGFGSSLREAVQNARNKSSEAVVKLIELGVPESFIETMRFHSGENSGDKPWLSSGKDYRAYINVRIKLDKLELMERVILTLSDIKVHSIGNIQFKLQDEEKHKMDAIGNAAAEARKKAEIIAKNVGAKGITPYTINEQNAHIEAPVFYTASKSSRAGDASPASGFQPQEITVRANVQAVFQMQ